VRDGQLSIVNVQAQGQTSYGREKPKLLDTLCIRAPSSDIETSIGFEIAMHKGRCGSCTVGSAVIF
jgi:hypothetical protein